MIITFGASTWRSGRGSFPALQIRSETALATAANSPSALPGSHPTAALLGEVAGWRAANGVDPQDRRAAGPDQLQISSAEWQRHLERRIAHASDNPTTSDIRTQEVGFTFQVRRDKARRHWPGPSANNRRSGPPRLGR